MKAVARVLGVLFAVAGLSAGAVGCRSVENAAARDPMRCERNPACAKQRAGYSDCSKQCNDDPACMDRCHQTEVDHLGKP